MPIETSKQRFGYFAVVIAAIFVIIWGVRGLAGLLNPILLAAVITITLLPVPSALMRRGVKSGYALLITILLVVLVLVLIAWLVLVSLAQLNVDLPALASGFEAQQLIDEVSTASPQALADEVMRLLDRQQFNQLFASIIGAVGSGVAQFFMTLLIFVFMLYTGLSLPNVSRLGLDTQSAATAGILNLTADVRRYIVLSTAINLVVGIGNTILLWIVGVPFALLWGIVSWVLAYIPAVGYWLALIPPVLLAYSQQGLRTALIVFIGYALINGTGANIITPRVLGKGLKISPLIVFISVFIWAWLLGAVGAILAMPLTMLLIVILDSFEATQWIASIMRYVPGSDQQPDPDAVVQVKGLWSRIRAGLPKVATTRAPATGDLPEATPPDNQVD